MFTGIVSAFCMIAACGVSGAERSAALRSSVGQLPPYLASEFTASPLSLALLISPASFLEAHVLAKKLKASIVAVSTILCF